jgi:hypothetical protein
MPTVLGKRVGGFIRKKRAAKKHHMQVPLGTMVGRALVLNRNLIELKRGDKLEDWTDWRQVYGAASSGSRSGLAGKLISQAEMGGNIARDLHHVISNRGPRYNPSAEVGPFKVAQNSPNTIRVSAGPERRDRRKKYEWERAETKRKIQKAVFTVALVGGGTLGVALHNKGLGHYAKAARAAGKDVSSSGGVREAARNIIKGAGLYTKEGAEKTKSAGQYVVDKILGRKPTTPTKKKATNLQKKADMMRKQAPESDEPSQMPMTPPAPPPPRPKIKMPEDESGFKVVPKNPDKKKKA